MPGAASPTVDEIGSVAVCVGEVNLRSAVLQALAAAGRIPAQVEQLRRGGGWSIADPAAAAAALERGMTPERLLLVCRPEEEVLALRLGVGAGVREVVAFPEGDGRVSATLRLVRALSVSSIGPTGTVIGVLGGHGGAGASSFAAALAGAVVRARRDANVCVVDLDPLGSGADRFLGLADVAGLRWPDLRVRAGTVSGDALTRSLPTAGRIATLSFGVGWDPAPARGDIASVISALRTANTVTVLDLSRGACAMGTDWWIDQAHAADAAVVLSGSGAVSLASTTVTVAELGAHPNAGLVLRGPAPAGASAVVLAKRAGIELWAGMRPDPQWPDQLERGEPPHRRGILAAAADLVLRRAGVDAEMEAS